METAQVITQYEKLPFWVNSAINKWINSQQKRLSTPFRQAFIKASQNPKEPCEWFISYLADDKEVRYIQVNQ